VRDVVDASPHIHLYPNFTGDALDRLVTHGRIVLIGDAAHPHGGAFAAGDSLGIDDAYILMRSFAHYFEDRAHTAPKEPRSRIARSLELYEQTRHSHTFLGSSRLCIVGSSTRTRRIMRGMTQRSVPGRLAEWTHFGYIIPQTRHSKLR
jgi:salicylate hydroxylase